MGSYSNTPAPYYAFAFVGILPKQKPCDGVYATFGNYNGWNFDRFVCVLDGNHSPPCSELHP